MKLFTKLVFALGVFTLSSNATQTGDVTCSWCHKSQTAHHVASLSEYAITCEEKRFENGPITHTLVFPHTTEQQFYGVEFMPTQGDCYQQRVSFIASCQYNHPQLAYNEVLIHMYARHNDDENWYWLETIRDVCEPQNNYSLQLSIKCDGAVVITSPNNGQRMYFLGKPFYQ